MLEGPSQCMLQHPPAAPLLHVTPQVWWPIRLPTGSRRAAQRSLLSPGPQTHGHTGDSLSALILGQLHVILHPENKQRVQEAGPNPHRQWE